MPQRLGNRDVGTSYRRLIQPQKVTLVIHRFGVALIAALLISPESALAQPAPSPSPTAASAKRWVPLTQPTKPPVPEVIAQYQSDISNYQMQSYQITVPNVLATIFAPYCPPGEFSNFALNGKAEAPAYPVTVTCVHSRWRVDAPGKVVKLP